MTPYPARSIHSEPFLFHGQRAVLDGPPGDAVTVRQPGQALVEYAADIDPLAASLQTIAQFEKKGLQCLVLGALTDVAEGADGALQLAVAVDRRDPVFHRQAAAVDAEEQFVLDVAWFAGRGGVLDRAVLHRVRAAVRMAVMDHMVQLAA